MLYRCYMKRSITVLLLLILLAACTDPVLRERKKNIADFYQSLTIRHDTSGYYNFYEISIPSRYSACTGKLAFFLFSADISDDSDNAVTCKILTTNTHMFIPADSKDYFLAVLGNLHDTGPFYILKDIPGPEKNIQTHTDIAYITTQQPDSIVCISGIPTEISMSSDSEIIREYSFDDFTFLSFSQPGYYHFDVKNQKHSPHTYNIFVSPVNSVHTDRIDLDWYYTQFRTITTSNCGPTVVSMALAWARALDISVPRVREIIGWQGSGAVNFQQMQQVLYMHGVDSEIRDFTDKEQIFDLISEDKLVCISYNMAGLTYQPRPRENFFDQYYIDHGGHYLALKGYSADKKYFIIYDPIPSDWQENRERYADGVSMYGRNRYYDADELVRSFTKPQILVVSR